MPAQKLKESCDLCSASKVRCDKQRPTCARCANLHQSCSYSPARRAGRPWRVRLDKRPQPSSAMPVAGRSVPTRSARDPDLGSDISFEDMPLLNMQARRLNDNKQFLATAPLDPGDCATTAVSILEQLDCGGGSGKTGPTSSHLPIADVCQRLLTIFICPCSEQPDVALLVACVCISLVDVVRRPNTADTMRSAEMNTFGWSVSPRPHSSSGNDQCRVDQLAKIAKVVLNFTEKYSQLNMDGSARAHTAWVVAPIVALLRSRLQSATHEATGRLIV